MSRYLLTVSTAFVIACATQLQAARVYTYSYAGAPIALPANPGPVHGYANPSPATIGVSAEGSILDVSVTLSGFTHTMVNEMTFYLAGPGLFPDSVYLFGEVTAPTPSSPVDLTFIDSAAGPIPNSPGTLVDGAYQPNGPYPSTSLNPSPLIPETTFFAAFFGDNPNGTWSLYAWDDSDFDTGVLNSWQLSITTDAPPWTGGSPGTGAGPNSATPEPATGMVALLAMAGFAFIRRRRA